MIDGEINMMKLKQKLNLKVFILFIIFISLFLVACQNNEVDSKTDSLKQISSWQNYELIDLNTNENYKILELGNKPILVESFATWCPTCTKQQKEIKKLHDQLGDDIISVGLNTDPNEDDNIVLNQIKKNNFDWPFSIVPIEMTRELTAKFGNSILSTALAPLILICPDKSEHLLLGGFKSMIKINNLINEKC